VNGVPAYNKGVSIDNKGAAIDLSIELSYGVNTVMLYATNKNGISSLKQTFQVSYRENKVKPALYLVTIGASKYQQNTFDLKYAAKDAQDIETLFKTSNRFSDIKKMVLLNENVTVDNVRKINEFLANATVDDMVLITYAGHGVLDKNLEYYLSTYDIDFNAPEKNGLHFSEMETILENTKSRNKILMVDACHSGEIDKDEVVLTTVSKTEAGEIR
jgi:hypothetical protein